MDLFDRHDITDQIDSPDIRQPTDRNDPIDNREPAEPTLPMESTDPTEPTERIDPRDPMERSESSHQSDQREPCFLGDTIRFSYISCLRSVGCMVAIPMRLLPNDHLGWNGAARQRATWSTYGDGDVSKTRLGRTSSSRRRRICHDSSGAMPPRVVGAQTLRQVPAPQTASCIRQVSIRCSEGLPEVRPCS
jgi:hypothetical protein